MPALHSLGIHSSLPAHALAVCLMGSLTLLLPPVHGMSEFFFLSTGYALPYFVYVNKDPEFIVPSLSKSRPAPLTEERSAQPPLTKGEMRRAGVLSLSIRLSVIPP